MLLASIPRGDDVVQPPKDESLRHHVLTVVTSRLRRESDGPSDARRARRRATRAEVCDITTPPSTGRLREAFGGTADQSKSSKPEARAVRRPEGRRRGACRTSPTRGTIVSREIRAKEPRVGWKYEPDQIPKRKHHWAKKRAGVVEVKGVRVSKCPSDLTLSDAEEMLNDGIEWSPSRWPHDHPQRVYAIREGVVYRATPTNPGVSYHGFPELLENLPPSRALRQQLIARATTLGCESEVVAWLRS